MVDDLDNSELLALLAWWREAGVDVALDEVPTDWTAQAEAPGAGFTWPDRAEARAEPDSDARPLRETGRLQERAPPPSLSADRAQGLAPKTPTPPRAPEMRATPGGVSGAAARAAAQRADSLDTLADLLGQFDGCALKATAKNLCFYRGSATARVMVIGEAPGRDEDLAGKPFVGRAGQLLDRMLAAIELTEADVHITNIVYWRPPGNRTPTPEEAASCRPFLERQMQLVAPDVILTLGGPAAKAILDVADGIMRLRGKWREIASGDRTVPVMPTLHPAYLLRQPAAKQQAWRDLLALKIRLDDTAKGSSG
ncbi:MAG: uracil-DNA glycosylase [Hyphomicrobiaceae bacterium]